MAISALDESGNPIDWWFLYKVPKLSGAVNGATGYEYLYYDHHVSALKLSPNKLTDGKGALDSTLDAVFRNPSASTGWILYNDEMPASAQGHNNASLGHTKGVLAFDLQSQTGFWLLHSWPQYADPGAVGMPTPMYGQTFLCLSLTLETIRKLAQQMADHQQPQTYLPRLPAGLPQDDPLYRLTQPLNPSGPGDSDAVDYQSRGGLTFKVIAKNRKWGKDFWNDLVGPTLQQDMDVETWIRGPIPPVLDSDGIHKTFDIKYIDTRPLGTQWAWPETHDHAKWGLTYAGNWVCVGDINRMISQENRGGGTIALQDAALWQALKQTDLLIPPPGMSMDDTKALLEQTHKSATG